MNKVKTAVQPVPTVHTATSLAIEELRAGLDANLAWLDVAFGICEFVPIDSDAATKRPATKPGVYTGGSTGNNYTMLFPDDHPGNFSFFVVEYEDYQVFGMGVRPTVEFRLVFWFDYRKIYPTDHENRTIFNVQAEVLAALEATKSRASQYRIDQFLYPKERVYQGFSHNLIPGKDLMRPYGFFGLRGVMKVLENC